MPSPLLTAGAGFDSPPKYVPLHVNRWWTGLWTNRSVLRDAATTYLIEKFYAGARFESMLDGVNIELSPRLTPIRRPGNSVYNSQDFPAINDFYAFRVFDKKTFAETIRVIADSAATVYDATGPSTKISILTKAAGSTQTSFLSVGNTLYMADGVDLKKFVIVGGYWNQNTVYKLGESILDANNNIETVIAVLVSPITVTQAQITSNVLTVTFTSTLFLSNPPSVGSTVYLYLNTFVAANGIPLTVTSVTSSGFPTTTHTVTMDFTNVDYGPASDTGKIYVNVSPFGSGGISGSIAPTWPVTAGLTPDNSLLWSFRGSALIDWQPIGPTTAPNVVNIPNANLGSSWAANTYYNPSLVIVDPNSNVQLLTTAGTTGTVPSWSTIVGAVTNDGSTQWTCQGTSVRAQSHSYTLGALIQVTFFVTIVLPGKYGDDRIIELGPYTDIFACTTAGLSSSAVTGLLEWAAGIGTQVQDGTVVWTNQGSAITRTAAATSASNIGNSQLVSLDTLIVDSNGKFEQLSTPGESGGTAPTWATAQGSVTADNQVRWVNNGNATAANTGTWVYGYAFKNSVTGDISECSPKSAAILLQASSLIAVSGSGDPNWATDGVDTIEIYRSVQGFSTLFFLADIPAPPNGGAWNYADASPDPPSLSTTLNEFISADVVGNNASPPAGMVGLSYYLSRMWGIVGEFVWYSAAPNQSIGVNTDNWPGENFFQFPSAVTKLWPNATGMMFFTNHGLYLSVGTDSNGNPNQPIPFLDSIGLLSRNAFTVNGSNPLLFTGDKQLIMLDPSSGVSRIGFPIEDILQTFDPTAAYITWHTKGPDQAAYIADGSGNWYRVNLTPAPETGSYSWSPKASVVGGFKCLKSIETSPGVQDLLLGPNGSTSTKILKRDPTVWQDNGTSYPAFFTIGSIVLAQPGQAAEIGFLTIEELKVGSAVVPAILADEVSGAFETMPDFINDPPWATPSNSVYSYRWYFGRMQTPAWMRYMQVRFTWPVENFQNELLTWSPCAAIHQDAGN